MPENTNQALVRTPASAAPAPFQPEDLRQARWLAEEMAKSTLLPPNLRNRADDVYVTLLFGHDLGLSPAQSLFNVDVVEGKPRLNAVMTVALVKRSPVCRTFRLLESSDTIATYETLRNGDPEPTRLSYTIEQATKAGLTKNNNWAKHPATMLRHRCSQALAKIVYPDVIGNLYDEDEIDEMREAARQEMMQAPPPAPAKPASRAPVIDVKESSPPAPRRGVVTHADRMAAAADHPPVVDVKETPAPAAAKQAAPPPPSSPPPASKGPPTGPGPEILDMSPAQVAQLKRDLAEQRKEPVAADAEPKPNSPEDLGARAPAAASTEPPWSEDAPPAPKQKPEDATAELHALEVKLSQAAVLADLDGVWPRIMAAAISGDDRGRLIGWYVKVLVYALENVKERAELVKVAGELGRIKDLMKPEEHKKATAAYKQALGRMPQ